MTREIINTLDAPRSASEGRLPYSQAVRAAGLVFVSGQLPIDPRTGDVVGSTIQEQTRQCLTNVEAILAAADSSIANVVSTTFFLLRSDDFAGKNEEWARWFAVDPPARQGARAWWSREDLLIGVAVVAEA